MLKWETIDRDYRKLRAEDGDYLLIVEGAGKYQFNYAVFFRGNSILSSAEKANPLSLPRSTTQAQQIAEAIYLTHKQCN